MISELVSDDLPLQMKSLNMVIPILMHFFSFVAFLSVASRILRHQMKCDVINDVKLFPTVYCRICCRKCLTLSN